MDILCIQLVSEIEMSSELAVCTWLIEVTHQGRENIASHPLKILQFPSFLWKFPKKIAPITLHFPEILALKIFTPTQVFFFKTQYSF